MLDPEPEELESSSSSSSESSELELLLALSREDLGSCKVRLAPGGPTLLPLALPPGEEKGGRAENCF